MFSLPSPEIDGGSTSDAQSSVAQPAEEELSSHEFYQRGITWLERSDRKGNIDQAITEFQRALARDQTYAPALAGLARAYWMDFRNGSQDAQRLGQALAAAEQAVREDPYLAAARVVLGRVYTEMGRFEDAVRELDKALELEPSNSDAWSALGEVSKAQGNRPQAEERFRRAIAAEPNKARYHSELGVLLYDASRYEEAADAFSRGLALAPESFSAHRNLGATYYMQGRIAEAAAQFQQALQIKPDFGTYSNLGKIYFTQGLYAQSASAFDKAIESGGANNYLMWGNLGDALRWTPDSESRARDAYTRAIQLLHEKLVARPKDVALNSWLALYLAKRGSCNEALVEIKKVEVPKDEGSAWYRLAVAKEVCSDREGALAALEAALQARFSLDEVKLDPELLSLRQDVRYHQLAMNYQP
ncbi:MAG: tetratricopeptide repeat protein [Thermoanaerobaculia bacterium]|nr:tetratricopeptide repeat protein [Thermoanaerobaculia bacterium]